MTSLDGIVPDRTRFRRALRDRLDAWLAMAYRHDILTARAVEGVRRDAVGVFDAEMAGPLVALLSARLPAVPFIAGGDILTALGGVRSEIDATVERGARVLHQAVRASLGDLAERELVWLASAADKLMGTEVGGALVSSVAPSLPAKIASTPWLGEATETWFERDLADNVSGVARAWVTTGIQRGLSTEEITRGLVGTRGQSGILDRPRHAVRALVRTAATAATTVVRNDAFRELGVTHWRFVATLDLRTSVICASQDGRIYPLGEGPSPPLHPNCRSVAVPVGSPDERPIGQRAALGGRVPATVTFEEWLRAQPAGDQDLVLGKAKAAAWRSGKLSIRDMLGRDLQPLSLDELRRLDRI